MSKSKATYRHWLSEKLSDDLQLQTKRLLHAKDVKHLRLMADAHLANDVCVGCVLATSKLVYPSAVGGDIGCGMLSIPIDMEANFIQEKQAAQIFKYLTEHVPIVKQRKAIHLKNIDILSSEKLQHIAMRDGQYQLGTLGRGNHFIELHACNQSGQLWLTIHTGSRAMGPSIRDYHLGQTQKKSAGIKYLDLDSEQGKDYFQDMQWAREYANTNRMLILERCKNLFQQHFSVSIAEEDMIHCDHNHIEKLTIANQSLLVHRKGACSVNKGEQAIIPGSMGSDSFHVVGKGNADSLYSSSHGAGRCMSRQLARNTISKDNLSKQLSGVFYQSEKLHLLTEEAPTSYKKIETVMNLQKKLVKVTRRLSPVLNYKGT